MNTKTELSHHKNLMKQWDKYKRMLSRKLGGIPRGWLILSDYCLDDPHKNACVTFTISPMQNLYVLGKQLREALPRDFKDIGTVPEETLLFLRDYKYFFTISIILTDINKSEIVKDLQNMVQYICDNYTKMPPAMIHRIKKFREYLKRKNKNHNVLKNLSLVALIFSQIVEFLSIKHSAKQIQWISDRDDVLNIEGGIIFDIINIITTRLIRGRRRSISLGVGLEDKKAGEYGFDVFIRYPDIVTGAVSSLDYEKHRVTKPKHLELLINSVFKNPNILMLQLKNERLNLIRYVPNPKFSSSAIIRVENDKNLIPQAPSNLC